jgi:hypothetical protein
MPSNWFIVEPDQELGPFTSAQLARISHQGNGIGLPFVS